MEYFPSELIRKKRFGGAHTRDEIRYLIQGYAKDQIPDYQMAAWLMAICFRGFSTFAARPLLNIHDFVVLDQYRGQGIGRRVMDAVEAAARRLGCCKLTLEVQDNNHRARAVYATFGFQQSVYVAEAGGALFMSKPLY